MVKEVHFVFVFCARKDITITAKGKTEFLASVEPAGPSSQHEACGRILSGRMR